MTGSQKFGLALSICLYGWGWFYISKSTLFFKGGGVSGIDVLIVFCWGCATFIICFIALMVFVMLIGKYFVPFLNKHL